jgi:hypothetical protein
VHVDMDACDHSKQGLESEIPPEIQNDPESEVTDCCDPFKKAFDKSEVSHKNFDIDANDQSEQGPEPEIGTENQQGPEPEVTEGGDTSANKPGNSIGTEGISPGEGGSDDNCDGTTLLQSNTPLSGKALMYQQYLESKQNDTTMNVPGDNVVTDVISPVGGGSKDNSDGPIVLPSNSSLRGKTLLYEQYLEKGRGRKYRTGKLSSSVTSQCLYHDVFTMYLRHFLPNDLYFLKDIIQEIITTLTSLPNRCTITPVAKVNLEVDSWTTTCKATTAGSSLGFEDNVCEDTLSSQSTYKINIGCLYYKASIAPNPKLLNDFAPSKEQLEKVNGGIMEEVNKLRLQIASNNTLFAIDHQGKTINTNVAEVQAQNVVFWLLDDIELVDWTTTIFFCKIVAL